jgi:adenosylhomocysteine nucleosidase
MQAVILISANTEWRAVLPQFPNAKVRPSPLGEWFETKIRPPQTNGQIGIRTGILRETGYRVVFFHGGWGKIAAAASTQYVIDRWSPQLLVNLGTCGGFRGAIERGEIVLVEKTIVYDIVEQMSDPEAAVRHYMTEIDLSWLSEPYPHPVRRTLMVSGDRDLIPDEVPALKEKFGAVAGDWESGAIAWVAAHNKTRCLILRGVTDLVGPDGGEAYGGNRHVFAEGAAAILKQLIEYLPAWIAPGTNHGRSS